MKVSLLIVFAVLVAAATCEPCAGGFDSQWFTYKWKAADETTGLPSTSDPDVDAISVASPILYNEILFTNTAADWPQEVDLSQPFAARFTANFYVFAAGDFAFRAESDDGVVLKIDGDIKISAWKNSVFAGNSDSVTLDEAWHTLELQFLEHLGGERVKLEVKYPGSSEFVSLDADSLGNGISEVCSCPAGFALFVDGEGLCQPCDAGKYESGGECLVCPSGTTSNETSASCTCIAGFVPIVPNDPMAQGCGCAAGQYLLNGVCETCGANEFSAAGSTSCKSCPSYTSSVAGSERCECSQDAGGLCPLCVSGFESQWFTYTWDETDQATGLPNTSDPDVDAISVASPILYNEILFTNTAADWPQEVDLSQPFAARFTANFYVFAAGDFAFRAESDDGVVLKIDGDIKISAWRNSVFAGNSDSVTLDEGWHTLELQFFEHLGGERVKLEVKYPGSSEFVSLDADSLGNGISEVCNCPPGHRPSPGEAGICLPCDGGFYLSGGQCLECPANTFSSPGSTSCTACPSPNTFSLPGSAGCSCTAPFTNYDEVDGCLCGDGLVQAGEQCDDGTANGNGASCKSDCTLNVCGDGIVGPREGCDDGNTENGDGCSAACVWDLALCDLVQSCGDFVNSTCGVRQSTFFKYNDPGPEAAVDSNEDTCMQTANAVQDPNPQWVRLDLGQVRLVGTVRFSAAGVTAEYNVMLASEDAAWVTDDADKVVANPNRGGLIPSITDTCTVTGGNGVFEATCGAAAKGQYVFIARAAPGEVLSVCDAEVFSHQCLAPSEEVECGLGYEPSDCESCRGCVPCKPGFYSDKVGDYTCTPCPGSPQPYSPAGSTSVFQCEGDAFLDGTSTLEVDSVAFNTTIDSWEIEIEFAISPHIQINGLSTLFMSTGGDASPANDGSFQAKNFPCRADSSRAAGADHSASLEETVCCLQDMRQDYLMTKIFRDFTDGLDLVAANDKCDAEDGSNMLVNADLDVVGAEGTVFVGTDGSLFSNSITVELLPGETRRSSYTGSQRAKITIPDSELYKISKSLNPDGNLTDSRELFIGLLDLLPTGTRVVDSASQQISIVLTRTQYGTFAAYGEQNIDYDFISFLNGRAHRILNSELLDYLDTSSEIGEILSTAYFAEISFVWDDRLKSAIAGSPVLQDSVRVTAQPMDPLPEGLTYNPCSFFTQDALSVSDPASLLFGAFLPISQQPCAPSFWENVAEDLETCPQVTIEDDHFSRIYIPLLYPPLSSPFEVKLSFDVFLGDASGRNDTMTVDMVLVVDDFVTHCDEDEGSVDLAQLVTPRIIVGTEADAPARLTGWSSMEDGTPFATGAETLQDGLVTLILDLDDSKVADEDNVNSLDNLELFFEDVLVVHVNPGSQPDINDIRDAVTDGNSKYAPTHNYDPDSRDAWLNIPPALKTDCPAEDATTSFFGCVHKHILRNKVITNETDAYFVGSSPPPAAGAQDFVETMLGHGTASVAARELGRDFEQYLMTTEGVTGSSPKSIGLWINPGHKWGGVTANSEYSLSNHLIIHVLFGVRSGVDGSERRMLLSTNGDGTTSLVRTLEYNVNAATLMESVLDNVLAIEVEAQLALSAEEACMPMAQLLDMCSERLEAAVTPHASKVERVECVSVQVENANCDGTRRADSAPVANVVAVIALAKSADAFLNTDAVVASGSVLGMKQTAGNAILSMPKPQSGNDGDGDAPAASDGTSSSSNNAVMVGAAAGAAAGVAGLALAGWHLWSKRGRRTSQPLTEVVSAGVVGPSQSHEPLTKVEIEDMLFARGAGSADSQKQLLPARGTDSV